MTRASDGWRSRWPSPPAPIRPAPRCSWRSRCEPRSTLRVVEVDHDQAIEPDPRIEVGEEGVDRVRLRQVDAGGPRVRRVEAEPEAVAGDATSGGRLGDGGQLGDVGAESEAAPRRVLEHDRRSVEPAVDLGEHEGQPVRQALRPELDAGTAVRADVDVDEPRQRSRAPPAGRRRGRPTDRPNESSSGPARLTRYEAWMAIGPDVELAEPRAERAASAGGFARRRQAVGLSPKTWSAVAPISWRDRRP